MHSANARRSSATTGSAHLLSPTVLLARSHSAIVGEGSGAARSRISPNGRSGSLGMEWVAAPEVFPAGAMMAVLHGEPRKPVPFIVFLRFPDGYAITPHVHANDEHLTVIVGTLEVGLGTERRGAEVVALTGGQTLTVPAGQPHFVTARGTTIVQLNAVGPLDISYVSRLATAAAARG